jgi:ribosomal-protein-alanine N-acetyltransferase
MPFPDSFSTARLHAERLTPDHMADLRAMDRDPQFMAFLGGPRDDAATAAYLARNLQHWTDYGFGLWILREAATQSVAGRAVLRHLLVEGGDEVELGYAFFAEFWGRGLATEIATACRDFGLDALHLPSVVAITQPANLASQRVLTKVGLVFERQVSHDGVPHLLFRFVQQPWGV